MNIKNEIIDFLDEKIQPDYLVTIPLNKYYQSVDSIKKSRIIFQLLTRVNRSIFSKTELRNKQELKCVPYTEKYEDAIHLLIELPDCERYADYDLKNIKHKKIIHLKIKQIFLKHIRKMNLTNVFMKDFYLDFFKPVFNSRILHQYCQKKNKSNNLSDIAETIDITNIRV